MSTTNTRFQELQLRQTDSMLQPWRTPALTPVPATGWSKAIRGALGMSAAAMARRLGLTHAGVRCLERAEADGVITLASLRKLAGALDCEVKYAFVPRRPLTTLLQERARELALERIQPVAHSMALEDQAVDSAMSKAQVDVLAQEILQGPRRELW